MKDNKEYNKKVRKILKTYNSILVKCKSIPVLSDKNIVMVCDIKGMINAQVETRKPILYFEEVDSTSFMLFDGRETYVYIIKANEGKENTIEKIIHELEVAKNTFVKEILANIEKLLLNDNIKSENILAENEVKFLENEIKYLQNERNVNNANNINPQNTKEERNMYLVPVNKQKKGWFFKGNKKPKKAKRAKRAKENKHERRRMIG